MIENKCHTGEFYTFSYSYSLLEFEYKIQETSSVNSNPGLPKRLISFGYKQVNLYLHNESKRDPVFREN